MSEFRYGKRRRVGATVCCAVWRAIDANVARHWREHGAAVHRPLARQWRSLGSGLTDFWRGGAHADGAVLARPRRRTLEFQLFRVSAFQRFGRRAASPIALLEAAISDASLHLGCVEVTLEGVAP